MTECAIICEYDPEKRHTLRALRSFGITKLVNSTGAISEKDKLLASRRTNLSTHALYQRSTQGSRDARDKVFGAKPKNPEPINTVPTSSVSSYVSLDTSKNTSSSIASLSVSKSEESVEKQSVINKGWLKPELAHSPFPPSIPFPYFHQGHGMPGYPPIQPVSPYSYPPPAYAAIPHPSYTVQDSSVQVALNNMQDAFSKMSEKLATMQDEMNKNK